MDEGHALAVVGNGVFDRGADQPFAAFFRYRFDPDGAGFREADLAHTHFVLQEVNDLLRFRAAGTPFDPRIDVFRIFPEHHHIGLFRMFYGGGHAGEITDRAQAHIKIQLLTQGHVQGAEPFADGGGQRAFDGDPVFPDRIHRFLGQPGAFAVNSVGFFPGVNFHPLDLALAAVCFFHCGVPDHHGSPGDVRTCAVAFDVSDDRVIRHVQFAVCTHGDLFAVRGHFDLVVSHCSLLYVTVCCCL